MKNTIIQYVTAVAVLLATVQATAQQSRSSLVSVDSKGHITYKPYTDKGDIIPDFSHCGYGGGGVAIPNVAVVARVAAPSGNDDTQAIQHIIDSVSRLPLGKEGFRGAILLDKGIYRISAPIVLHSSGVVLRGAGDNKSNGTVLLAISPKKYNVIELGVGARLKKVAASERAITDTYVPSGSCKIHVENASKWFRAGDAVVVHRPGTKEWIHATGMDSIPPRPMQGESTHDSFNRLRREGVSTNMNGTRQWTEGSKDLLFERTIKAVDGNEITLDIPIVNALQKEFGGATIYKYDFPERISHCGVENLYGMSLFDPKITQDNQYIGTHFTDEQHANNFVYCKAIEHAWIRNVKVEHFDCCVWTAQESKFITGQDLSATNPVSVITGGRRYAYSVWGQMGLFQRCYSSHHRHEFVLGASIAGPNAFVDSDGDMTFASSEPHQRWAAGCLFDNIAIRGPEGSLLAVNRGWYGSGHGWAGAQMVFWNCAAPVIMVMQPPTAQNFAIGAKTKTDDPWDEAGRTKTIRSINGVSRSNFQYDGVASVGDGWIEHADATVYPRSLYYMQLRDRLGEQAVKNVATQAQYDYFINNK